METPAKPHIGRKISRIRELRGMKQEALAQALGMSQQSISILENSAEVDEKRLADVAEALGVSAEAIKAFTEEAIFNFFNTITDNEFTNTQVAFGTGAVCNFNPLDKVLELFEENKRLYERLLEAEREKLVLMERLLGR
ncbi:helix-turn-helix transcriptional regulator [Flavobacterium sp.]|uniref:helix-turn-helix domain-containing protein n=1 Tax=Flavobacterium sp. TaxID=239 RepID=UPI0012026A20|nr:helix-turn-helix transcriptional regulator [Flavobacterium sp.]RZJ71449.1 MAG: XRE family transcriptional regulator [Flavobacterium sp.]